MRTRAIASAHYSNTSLLAVWAALIVHLVLRYLKFTAKWSGSYTRFVGLVRTALWMKKDIDDIL